ncbi:MAG: TolC family protein, partial [Gemmatimonadaceae bacterium]
MTASRARRSTLVVVAILAHSSIAAAQSTRQALTLRELLDSTAANYPTIEGARDRARAAEGLRRSAGAFANPVATYQVENTRFPGGGNVSGIDKEASAMLMLPLEPFYQRGSRVRQANALVDVSRAEIDVVRQGVLRDAAHAFYRLARSQDHLAALEDVARWLDTLVAYNTVRVKEGVAAEADLIRTELERDRAVIETATERAELARAQAALAAFVGGPPSRATSIVVAAGTRPIAIDDLRVDSSGTRRPELSASQARLAAADAGIGVERRMVFRDVGATIGTKQMMGTTSMIAGPSIPFPLFDRNGGQISRAIAERNSERLELVALTRVIEEERAGAAEAMRILTRQIAQLSGTSRGGGILSRAEQAEQIA